jgi:molybdopterin-dependent oxidoreductase alpha subunit
MNATWNRRLGPYREILRAAWQNKDRPGYAWRILRDGVCDGCALGTSGMRDWTLDGVHLCWLRLNLLRVNTMPSLEPALLADLGRLPDRSEPALRRLGRLPVPLLRRRGEPGFTPVSWENALALMAGRWRAADPRRTAVYVVSRGTVNETYYAAQKAARALGTNHVDNSARICHSPSTVALKETIGHAASTVSYRDLIGADLVILLGSDVANNQPVMMKYLHLARKAGTRVLVVNPYREPGLERYWVPSSFESAVLGTRVADAFYPVRVGGDLAFLNGVLKHLIANGWIDRAFLDAHTTGWEALAAALEAEGFEDLERLSGVSRQEMLDFARRYAGARSAVFVWSMGITMHRSGVDTVKAIVNVALARGMIGRERSGLMPIRGHSGVQGGTEMGCAPNLFPGGFAVDGEGARRMEALWGFPVPSWKGRFIAETVDAAHAGELDILYAVGGNLLGVLPDRAFVREALERIPLRIHHDVVLNPQMLVEPAGAVLVLPATTRYEMAGGNTETSTERRVIFNPEIPGPRPASARDEWRVLMDLARRVRPDLAPRLAWPGTAAIREEIARAVPAYRGIERLAAKGDQFQWGGARLAEGGQFGFEDGRARCAVVRAPEAAVPAGCFQLSTRRGKQFNSMVFGNGDLMSGAGRDTAVLAPEDLARLGLRDGDAVVVRSPTGAWRGRVRGGAVHPGTVLMTWPEANVLVPRGNVDPVSGIPAYRDAVVEVLPAADAGATRGSP